MVASIHVYDARLRYEEPPHFLDSVQAAWHVGREDEYAPSASAPATGC